MEYLCSLYIASSSLFITASASSSKSGVCTKGQRVRNVRRLKSTTTGWLIYASIGKHLRRRKLVSKEDKKPLAPVNKLVIEEPGTSGEVIKQQKIKAFFTAKEELKSAEKRYYDAYRQVQNLIMAGAEIQPGRFGIKYGVKLVRRRSYKQDIIDLKGKTFQIRLLESTHPHAEFYVRVKPPKP
jgi:hypothetical protein